MVLRQLVGVLSAFYMHIAFSICVVLVRYVQMRNFPTFALLGSIHLVILILFIPRLIYLAIKHRQKITCAQIGTFFKKEILTNWILYVFAISAIAVTLLLTLAPRFTKAIYVQLILLITPFVVSFICIIIAKIHRMINARLKKPSDSFVLFADERITVLDILALCVAVAGGILVIFGGLADPTQVSPTDPWYQFVYRWKLDFTAFSSNFSSNDILGIFLTLAAVFVMAIFWLVIRLIAIRQEVYKWESIFFISAESSFLVQAAAHVVFLIPSFAIEDWTFWARLTWQEGLFFAILVIAVYLFASLAQIIASQSIGPSATATLLPTRLVVTILAAALILQEYFATNWQLIGSVVVIIGITLYMVIKYFEERKRAKIEAVEKLKKAGHREEYRSLKENVDLTHHHEEHHDVSPVADGHQTSPSVEVKNVAISPVVKV
jgi:drug/metabolite transporter (DMT)-like permease